MICFDFCNGSRSEISSFSFIELSRKLGEKANVININSYNICNNFSLDNVNTIALGVPVNGELPDYLFINFLEKNMKKISENVNIYIFFIYEKYPRINAPFYSSLLYSFESSGIDKDNVMIFPLGHMNGFRYLEIAAFNINSLIDMKSVDLGRRE